MFEALKDLSVSHNRRWFLRSVRSNKILLLLRALGHALARKSNKNIPSAINFLFYVSTVKAVIKFYFVFFHNSVITMESGIDVHLPEMFFSDEKTFTAFQIDCRPFPRAHFYNLINGFWNARASTRLQAVFKRIMDDERIFFCRHQVNQLFVITTRWTQKHPVGNDLHHCCFLWREKRLWGFSE